MQVLLGLQSNALKFTQKGEVHIKVKIQNGYLQIAVQYSGVGISEENQEKLFKMFGFLEETQSQNRNGVGLGLVISKQIVEQFEGDIWVDSTLGEGSTFTFNFKIEPLEEITQDSTQMTHFISNSLILVYKWRPPNSSASDLIQQIDYVYEQNKEKDDKDEVFDRSQSKYLNVQPSIMNIGFIRTKTFYERFDVIEKEKVSFNKRILIVDD